MTDPLPPLPAQPLILPFEDGPWRMAMGLSAIDPLDLIALDDRYPAEHAERARLLDTRRDEVFAVLPGAEPACAEVLRRIADLLPARYPEFFTRDGTRLHNRVSGETWDVGATAPDPLEVAGRLVQEDLCLLRPGPAGPVLAAAVLCFPGRWRLADKLGQPLMAVHGPVPIYPDRLGPAVDRLIARLAPGKLVERANWSLVDDPALFQPQRRPRPPAAAPITAANAGDEVFLRVERQTLSLLPDSGHTLFTIRTHVHRLARAAADPATAARLAALIRSMPPAMTDYKAMTPFLAALLTYLDAAAAA